MFPICPRMTPNLHIVATLWQLYHMIGIDHHNQAAPLLVSHPNITISSIKFYKRYIQNRQKTHIIDEMQNKWKVKPRWTIPFSPPFKKL